MVAVRDRKARDLAADVARTDESDGRHEMNIDRNRGEVERLRSGPTGAKMIMLWGSDYSCCSSPLPSALHPAVPAQHPLIPTPRRQAAGRLSRHSREMAVLRTARSRSQSADAKFDSCIPCNRTAQVRFTLLWQLFREGTSGVKNELGRNSCVSCDGQQTNELGTVPQAAITCT